jgi:hypothetical protein
VNLISRIQSRNNLSIGVTPWQSINRDTNNTIPIHHRSSSSSRHYNIRARKITVTATVTVTAITTVEVTVTVAVAAKVTVASTVSVRSTSIRPRNHHSQRNQSK